MKSNNHLYKLIKSLDKSEKRYFKMVMSQHIKGDSSNYVLLFDAIDKQSEYNEIKLRKKFRDHSFGKNLSKTKYMLYRQVLKSLRYLYDAKSSEALVNSYIESVSTLFSKCLYIQCDALLHKAEVIASNKDLFSQLLVISSWKEKLSVYLELTDTSALNDFQNERMALLEQQAQEVRSRAYWVRATHIEDIKEEAAQKLAWASLMEQLEPLRKEEANLSFLTRIYVNSSVALFYLYQNEEQKAVEHWQSVFDSWQAQPERIIGKEDDFIFTNGQFVLSGLEENIPFAQYDQFFKMAQMLKGGSLHEGQKLSFIAVAMEFMYSVSKGYTERSKLLLMELEETLDEQLPKLPKLLQVNLSYHIGIYLFLSSQYEDAFEWIEKVEGMIPKGKYLNLFSYCKLIGLMAKYEIETYSDVIEYDVRNIYRCLKKRKQFKEIEKLVLNSVKRLLYVKDVSESKGIFANLCRSIEHVEQRKVPVYLVTSKAIYQWASTKLIDPKLRILN